MTEFSVALSEVVNNLNKLNQMSDMVNGSKRVRAKVKIVGYKVNEVVFTLKTVKEVMAVINHAKQSGKDLRFVCASGEKQVHVPNERINKYTYVIDRV